MPQQQPIPPEALEKLRAYVGSCEKIKRDQQAGKTFQFLKDPIPLTGGKWQIWMVALGLFILNPIALFLLAGIAWGGYHFAKFVIAAEEGRLARKWTGNSSASRWDAWSSNGNVTNWNGDKRQTAQSANWNQSSQSPSLPSPTLPEEAKTVLRIVLVLVVIGLYWGYRNGMWQEEIGAAKEIWSAITNTINNQ